MSGEQEPTPEQEKQPDTEPQPYSLASRFSRVQEALSKQVYDAVQETIRTRDCDLSAYRFQIPEAEYFDKPWFVAAIGERPTDEIHQIMVEILRQGELTVLPEATLAYLLLRRAVQIQRGPWVERHYNYSLKKKEKRKQQKQSRRRNRGQ